MRQQHVETCLSMVYFINKNIINLPHSNNNNICLSFIMFALQLPVEMHRQQAVIDISVKIPSIQMRAHYKIP